MRKDDPIVKFYDYQKGDLIKIIRKNGYITYRIVK
jgi:DNA-directed RNA polymerase subunit H (RpoH/RPB5)